MVMSTGPFPPAPAATGSLSLAPLGVKATPFEGEAQGPRETARRGEPGAGSGALKAARS